MGKRRKEYDPNEHPRIVSELMSIGVVDPQAIAKVLGVTMRTLAQWRREKQAFRDAMKSGYAESAVTLAEKVVHDAMKPRHTQEMEYKYIQRTEEVEEEYTDFFGNRRSRIVEKTFTDKIPVKLKRVKVEPDKDAAKFVLKCLGGWREKSHVEHSGDVKIEIVDYGADDTA